MRIGSWHASSNDIPHEHQRHRSRLRNPRTSARWYVSRRLRFRCRDRAPHVSLIRPPATSLNSPGATMFDRILASTFAFLAVAIPFAALVQIAGM